MSLTNTGGSSIVIESIQSSSSQFTVTGVTLPLSLSPYASTSFHVVFDPTSAASVSGAVTIRGGHKNSQLASIGVSGTGVAPLTYLLSLNSGGLGFGNQAVGTVGSLSFAINNTGTGPVTVSQVSTSGAGYSVNGFSGAVTLAAGQSLSLSINFAPAAAGYVAGSVTVVSTATNSPQSIPLSGTGVASSATYLLSLSAGGLGFGNQTVGTKGSLPLTINNTGTGSVTISQISTAGAGYSISGFSGTATLAAGQSLPVSVNFAPSAAGYVAGSVTVVSTATNSPQSIPLSGTGVAATLQLSTSAASLSFGNVNTGASASQSLVVTNSGNASVTVSQVTSSGTGFTVSGFSSAVTLAAGQSLSLAVGFAPTATSNYSGSVTVVSTAANSPISIPLSGAGVQSATYQLAVNTGGIWFASQAVGTTGSQPFSVTNTGTGSVTISQATTTGSGFGIGGFSGPVTLAAGQSLPLSITFAPSAASYFSATATIVSNATNSPLTFPLSGNGVASSLQLSASPASLSFGNVNTGGSASQGLTLTNSGNSSVTVSQVTSSGTGFSASGFSSAVTLAAGQSLSLTVGFAPTTAGSSSGSISVVSTATNSPNTISLSGTGVRPLISVVPSSVNFGSVATGVSNTQTVTVQNPGSATLTVSQVSASGTGYSLSAVATPFSVAAGGSASFNVAFSPASTGSFSGSVSLASNAPSTPTTIALSGTGAASTLQLSANPSSLSFGNITTGTSTSQTFTLTNTGNASVTISQVTPAGSGFSICSLGLPLTLSAGQSTSCSVAFAPSAVGSVTGSVTVTSNATNSPLVVALSGTGTAAATYSVSLSWSPSSSSYQGFNVYRGSVSGGPYTKVDPSMISSPSYTDSTVSSGQTYYYVATEVDSTGMESGYSSEVSAAIP